MFTGQACRVRPDRARPIAAAAAAAGAFSVAIAFVLLGEVPARAQSSGSMWDGVFTDAQAARGKDRYTAACASCHSEDLLGASGPALVGEPFLQRWNGSSVHDFIQTVRQTMPQDAPDSLGTPGYVDLAAFLLKSNGAPAGGRELPIEADGLRAIRMTSAAR